MEDIISRAVDEGASDIHITKDLYPAFRVNGELVLMRSFGKKTVEDIESMVGYLLHDKERLGKERYVDASIEYGENRFRVHIYHQKGSYAINMRIIPTLIPSFDKLNLPTPVKGFTLVKSGLVLVTGTTGSGKSTTLASIIDDINSNQRRHIITVEDPIEFVHEHKKSMVNQKEVGQDVNSFPDAVRSAMREDPDILLVGEMRDLETIQNTVTMAETGHLVFATLHTKSAAETVNRCIDVFPADQQEQIRMQLANTIQGIVSQHLLPKAGGGRVPACEVLIANDAIRSLIREKSAPNAINDQLQMNHKKNGSQTIYQGLVALYKKGLIAHEVALDFSGNSEAFKRLMAGIKED